MPLPRVPARRLLFPLAAVAGFGLSGAVLPEAALHWARPALLEVGPNDVGYLSGFRADWERDGRTRFRWTTVAANVRLPLRIEGEGHLLRMRVRRHFIEPARVRLTVEARQLTVFDLQADTKVPYRTIDVPLPALAGRYSFVLSIEAPSENPRPLGFALDWLEVVRTSKASRFHLLGTTRLHFTLLVLAAAAIPFLAGASATVAWASAGLMLAAASIGTAWDVIAAERIVREGLPALLAVGVVVIVIARLTRVRAGLLLPSASVAGGLATIVLWSVALRLFLLLHPQFYYPDVKVHSLFAWELARRGLSAFLRDFTVNQYRYSLGLQFERGHWYAFPYPPAFYLLTWPLVRLANERPEVAVSVLAAIVNGLEAILVFGIARRLRATAAVALLASAVHGLLPVFVARLTLGYFPALVGHTIDALLILYFLARLPDVDRPRVVVTIAALLALALLAYTQALLNFGILLGLFLTAQLAFDRTPGALRRMLALATAGLLGLSIAIAAFYGRYLMVFRDIQHGVPMAEERVLLEKLERARPSEEPVVEEPDPYTGAGVDLLRGIRKAGWRLYVFYGPFAVAVVAGIALLVRSLAGDEARWVIVWALAYVLLNLASGGLPGPNLVRYNKDLELIAPLCCLALAVVGGWLWKRAPVLATIYGAGFLIFSIVRATRYLTETFVLER
jgi:hypothetical protein